jgi:ABC-type lipoprotein export system ATPase subunit
VKVAGVGHWFSPGHWLFENLDLDLVAGRVYGIVGPSGSGKSTLLSLIAGWDKPKSGHFDRRDVTAIRWVFQNPVGVARRTTLDHVALPLVARGVSRRTAEAQAEQLLRQFGLQEVVGAQFGSLSGGERQRLMLARGLAGEPDLLLIDEPTAQLDRAMASTVNARLGALVGRKAIVVIATHDPSTADRCTDLVDLANPVITSTEPAEAPALPRWLGSNA